MASAPRLRSLIASYHRDDVLWILGLTGLQAVLARLSVAVYHAAGMVAVFWPAAGLSLAVLLLRPRLWPALFLGVFLGELWIGFPVWVAAPMALGSLLSASLGAWSFRRGAGGDVSLRTSRAYFRLVFFAGLLCPTLAAVNGAALLRLAGVATPGGTARAALVWWMGDALGTALVAPLILLWRRWPLAWRGRSLEVAVTLGGAVLVGQIVFLDWMHPLFGSISRGHWLYLVITWTALRLGAHGVSLVVVVTAAQALGGAARSVGFFAGDLQASSLVNLWCYTLILATVGMAVAMLFEERGVAAQTAHDSEARFRAYVESSPIAVLATDAEGRLVDANPAGLALLGVAEDGLGDCRLGELAPEGGPELLAALVGEGRASGELLVRGKGGRTLWVSLHAVRIGEGRFLAFAQDIDARRAAAAELSRHRDHLEELVSARTAELGRALAHKGEFLAHMSHEIRTPLNGVLGLAQIGHGESDGRARRTFGRILESGRLLLGVVDDILDFSKIEAGELRIEAVLVDPQQLARDATQLHAERARAKGIDLTVVEDFSLPEACRSDPLRLQQILGNLLSNAVKFTERGSVTLETGRAGEQLRFRIIDTGPGIAPAQLEEIFAPFRQADSSTTRKFGGTGLGLSITRQLVELMGGTIHVESKLGAGTTFEVRLPLVEAPAAERPPPSERPASRRAGGRGQLAGVRVLAAEDNDINQMVLEAFLLKAGAEVVIVGDGQQLLERLASDGPQAFDVVLMDVQMPVMDGYEATERLRATHPRLPVIGQTAHALAEERTRCLAAGMIELVTKPLDSAELAATILRCVSAARAAG